MFTSVTLRRNVSIGTAILGLVFVISYLAKEIAPYLSKDHSDWWVFPALISISLTSLFVAYLIYEVVDSLLAIISRYSA